MSNPPGQRSAQDLVGLLRGRGLTRAELARELDVSPRMVAKVETGETPGRRYTQTLTELAEHGYATHRPARRTTGDGQLVRVRAPRSTGAPSQPPQLAHQRTERGGFSSDTVYYPAGGRQHTVTAPKTETKTGTRELARETLLGHLRRAAQGRRKSGVVLHTDTGKNVVLGGKGGYSASYLLRQSNAEGKDPLGWLKTEAIAAADTRSQPGLTDEILADDVVVGVTVEVW